MLQFTFNLLNSTFGLDQAREAYGGMDTLLRILF